MGKRRRQNCQKKNVYSKGFMVLMTKFRILDYMACPEHLNKSVIQRDNNKRSLSPGARSAKGTVLCFDNLTTKPKQWQEYVMGIWYLSKRICLFGRRAIILTVPSRHIYTVIQDIPLIRVAKIRFPHTGLHGPNFVKMLRINTLKFRGLHPWITKYPAEKVSNVFPCK